MLAMRTGPVTVDSYDTYKKEDRTTPMTYGDGQPVEKVSFMVEGEARLRDLTLDKSVNGNRAKEGSKVELVLTSEPDERAEVGRSGRAYIKRTVKYRVVGFEPVR